METKTDINKLDKCITNMLEFNAKVKKWGNSLGIVIPKEQLNMDKLKEEDEVYIIAIKKNNTLKETFGILKGKIRSGQEAKDISRRDLYD